MAQALTVSEAVALTGVEEKTVRKEVEYGLFGDESPPRFKLPALVYLRVLRDLGLQTTVEDRKRIYTLIRIALAHSKKPKNVELSPVLELKLDVVTEEVRSMLERFEAWKNKIVIDADIMGGEPVFPKSRLTVRHVGQMMLELGLVPSKIFREDYPYLKPQDIHFAKLYTVAYPKVGRPRRVAPARATPGKIS